MHVEACASRPRSGDATVVKHLKCQRRAQYCKPKYSYMNKPGIGRWLKKWREN